MSLRRTPPLPNATRLLPSDDLEERVSGNSLLQTAFQHPDDDLLQLSQRTETPLGPASEDPASFPHNELDASYSLPRLPPDAPPWMVEARKLSLRLERAIARRTITRSGQLRIHRANLAYTALDASNPRIVRVAHVVQRAHRAIRDTRRPLLEPAFRDCAEILYGGLSARMRQDISFDAVIQIVRDLREEADPWAAVVVATATLLGWRSASLMHAAEAIRCAIEEEQQKSGG